MGLPDDFPRHRNNTDHQGRCQYHSQAGRQQPTETQQEHKPILIGRRSYTSWMNRAASLLSLQTCPSERVLSLTYTTVLFSKFQSVNVLMLPRASGLFLPPEGLSVADQYTGSVSSRASNSGGLGAESVCVDGQRL